MAKANKIEEIILGKNGSKFKSPVAIYARQSVEKLDSISIESQIKDCMDVYKSEKYAGLVYIFSDAGYSGKNTERPAYKEMEEMIENDEIHCVFVYKLDRISRSVYDFTQMQKLFEQHKVSFYSTKERFSISNEMASSMLQMAMIFAELERKNIQQRVIDNYYHRIKLDGRWAGGPAPYGFKNGKVNGVSSLIPFDEEMDVVEHIFDTFYKTPDITLGKLARDLTKDGYKARKSNFTNVSVGRILRNPIYVIADDLLYAYFDGKYFEDENHHKNKEFNFELTDKSQWDKDQGFAANIIRKRISETRENRPKYEHQIYITNVKGIIDSRIYIAIQEKLAVNKQLKKLKTLGQLQELTGLLKCSNCGLAIKMYNAPRLSCYGNVSLHKCTMKINPQNELTTAQAFDDLRIKIGMCVTRYFVQLAKIYKNVENIKENINKQIADNEDKIKNLVRLQANATPESEKYYSDEIAELSKEISEYRIEKDKHNKGKALADANKNLQYFKLTPPERRIILRKVIEKIEINPDYTFRIIWKSKAISDIEEYNTLEYTTNGRMRIKEEALEKLDDSQIDKLILETVELKVEATMYYCEMNGIEVPKSFFKRLSGQTLKNNYMLACEDALKYKQESACEPVAKSGIIISPNNDEKAGSKKYKRHASNRKTELLRQCIEDEDTSRLSPNEKMTVAFSLLLPEYKDGDQIEWLANTYNPKYAKIFSFLAI